MEIITKQYKVYTYDELNETAKENALNNYRESNDYPFLSEDIQEYINQELEKHNIKNVFDDLKVYYSLSYSQGDGVVFEGTFKSGDNTFKVKQTGHYTHEYSKTIEGFKTENGEDTTAKEDADFNSLFIDICKDAKKYGYSLIEFEDSEENIKDIFESNDYKFLENGEVFLE